jgi:uncharacterized protein
LRETLPLPQKLAEAAIELLDGGATVPFIARYRNEVTNGLMTRSCAFCMCV